MRAKVKMSDIDKKQDEQINSLLDRYHMANLLIRLIGVGLFAIILTVVVLSRMVFIEKNHIHPSPLIAEIK